MPTLADVGRRATEDVARGVTEAGERLVVGHRRAAVVARVVDDGVLRDAELAEPRQDASDHVVAHEDEIVVESRV